MKEYFDRFFLIVVQKGVIDKISDENGYKLLFVVKMYVVNEISKNFVYESDNFKSKVFFGS